MIQAILHILMGKRIISMKRQIHFVLGQFRSSSALLTERLQLGTGVLSGLAPDDTSQGGSITVRVSDGIANDDFGFTITITNSNPSFTSGVQSAETANNDTEYSHDYNSVDTDPNDD